MAKMQCKECCRDISEEEYNRNSGYCNICYKDRHNIENKKETFNKGENSYSYIEDNTIKNKIANKFKLVVNILKFLGYSGAILFVVISMIEGEGGYGILIGIGIAIATWFGCLFWEAVAEILQLLEDIKNKKAEN